METSNSAKNYKELQISIDTVIGKIGLPRTIFLLNSFVSNTKVDQNEREKINMITKYLTNIVIKVFDIREDVFLISDVREYRDARMCCFHLLRKYTGDTFAKIALSFQSSARIVGYNYTVAEDHLSMPKGNSKFVSNYTVIESTLIDFIGRIN